MVQKYFGMSFGNCILLYILKILYSSNILFLIRIYHTVGTAFLIHIEHAAIAKANANIY